MEENSHLHGNPAGHEASDVNVWAVGKFALALVFIILVSLVPPGRPLQVVPGGRRNQPSPGYRAHEGVPRTTVAEDSRGSIWKSCAPKRISFSTATPGSTRKRAWCAFRSIRPSISWPSAAFRRARKLKCGRSPPVFPNPPKAAWVLQAQRRIKASVFLAIIPRAFPTPRHRLLGFPPFAPPLLAPTRPIRACAALT